MIWGVPLSVSYHSAFSYCLWGSQGKNSEVVCHSLLQWTTFCQTSPPWPAHVGWPHTAWLSFTELTLAWGKFNYFTGQCRLLTMLRHGKLSGQYVPYGIFQGNSSCCHFCWQVVVGGSCSRRRSLSNHLQLKSLHVARNKSSYIVIDAGRKQQKQNNQKYCN